MKTPTPRTISARAKDAVESGRTYIGRLRARAIMLTLGLLGAAIATAAIIGGGWLPAVGTALAAAAVAVHRVAARLDEPRCMSCGEDLSDLTGAGMGAACPGCGAPYAPSGKS